MNTSDQLKAARELIEERGWWRMTDGAIHGDLGGVCIMQAVAGNRYPFEGRRAAHAFRCLFNAIGSSPFAWNDARGRTKAEVIALLLAVETTERAREQQGMPVEREQVTA